MTELRLADELLAAGLVADLEGVEEVHRTDGPAVITGCCRVGAEYAWLEHDRDGRLASESVGGALATLRALIGAEPWAAVPTVSRRGTAVHAGLAGRRVLVDLLLPAVELRRDDLSGLRSLYAALGRALAALHARRPEPADARTLLRPHPQLADLDAVIGRGRARGPLPNLALERLQERLLCGSPETAELAADAVASWGRCTSSAVLHGSFSPGYVTIADGPPRADGLRVIGWCDAAYGPPAFDLGHFLAETAELAAARATLDTHAAESLLNLGRSFLAAYRAARPDAAGTVLDDECSAFATVRILAHAAAFVRAYGFVDDAVEDHLALADRVAVHGWAEGALP